MKRTVLASHDQSVERLKYVWSVLEANGIRPWLDQGTLLGVVRDQRLIPWDNDIDLSCWEDEWEQAELAVVRAFTRSGSRVKVFRESLYVLPSRHCLPVSLAFRRVAGETSVSHLPRPVSGRARKRLQSWLHKCTVLRGDFGEYRSNRQTLGKQLVAQSLARTVPLRLALALERRLCSIPHEGMRTVTPMHFFRAFDRIHWMNHNWRVPQSVENYLDFKYGQHWRTANRDYDYAKEDGALFLSSRDSDD